MEPSDEEVPVHKEGTDSIDKDNVQNDADIQNRKSNSSQVLQEASPSESLQPPVRPLVHPLRRY